MRVAFVVPRYGPEIIGGAETAARMFAEHLVAGEGFDVEILTTCASDFVTWDDDYPPGTSTVGGVTVHRFPSSAGRDPSFHPLSAALLADPDHAAPDDAERWLDLQGPTSPGLEDAAVTTDADVLVFYPYLYRPTARVITRVKTPAVLHPAAHDEPALRLPVFPRVFAAADALVFQTVAERDLVQRRFDVATTPQLQLGLGVDEPGSYPSASPAAGRPAGPYLLCLGRVDRHKGSFELAGQFAELKARRPGPLRLVFAGPVVDAPPTHPDIDIAGPQSESDKWDLLTHALALVSPSRWEAFSLVVAEAWSAGTPVLVNAACGATVEHCRRSGGGVPVEFDRPGSLEVAVGALQADTGWARTLGRSGQTYVEGRFRWPVVIDRYARFLESVLARGRRT